MLKGNFQRGLPESGLPEAIILVKSVAEGVTLHVSMVALNLQSLLSSQLKSSRAPVLIVLGPRAPQQEWHDLESPGD